MRLHLSFAALALSSLVSANPGIFVPDGYVLRCPIEPSLQSPPKLARSIPEKRETNADRMRRGLPPLPPVRRASHVVPGHVFKPRASAVPCTPLTSLTLSKTGSIKLIYANKTVAGFIGDTFDAQNSHTVTPVKTSSQKFKMPSLSPFDSAFNIFATNGPDEAHPYLGAVGAAAGYDLSKKGYAYLAGVNTSPSSSPPDSTCGTSMNHFGYNGPSESQIWSMDCKTLEITATWTNADYSQTPATIFYSSQYDFLGLTGGLAKFNSVNQDNAAAVTMIFVPN
ncbi:hypothetical protein B0H19DRAFT_1239669, partial [Mycena capillaripes]